MTRILPVALLLVVPSLLKADEAEDKAVKLIEKLKGKYERDKDAGGRPIIFIELGYTKVTDPDIEELTSLKKLTQLDICGTKLTEAGLKEVAKLQQLRWLALDETKVTEAGLKEVAQLKQLESLYLSGSDVKDAYLKHLAPLKELKHLRLDENPITEFSKKSPSDRAPRPF
jgi:Leucine-rich repeat (LRR) protein